VLQFLNTFPAILTNQSHYRPGQAWTGLSRPSGFQKVKAPRFQDNRHMKVVTLSALRTGRLYPPGNIPGTQFCYRYSDWLRAGRSGDRIPVEASFFAHVQTGPEAHPASCTMGTRSFPGVKRPGRGADHPPLLAPRSRKSRAIPLPTL
jgi:hypothetical protein